MVGNGERLFFSLSDSHSNTAAGTKSGWLAMGERRQAVSTEMKKPFVRGGIARAEAFTRSSYGNSRETRSDSYDKSEVK
jgi:hypothetical protein